MTGKFGKSTLAILALGTAFASPALAAKRKLPPAPATTAGPAEYSVPVEQSEIRFAMADNGPRARSLDSRLQLMVSTWIPKGLQMFSFQDLTQSFRADRMPYASLAYLFSPFQGSFWRDLSFRAGAGYLQLGRSQDLSLEGVAAQPYRQGVQLVSLDLGAEWQPSFARWKAFSPYLGAGILPMMIFTTRSEFDEGRTTYGVPVSFSGGVGIRLPQWGSLGMPSTGLNLGVFSTLGSVSGSDAFSLGFQAGVQVEI